MDKKKLGIGLLLLLILPSAFLELLNSVYNLYVPIYLQAGGQGFSASGTLTLGFGVGAFVVGIWMIADNLWGFAVNTFAGTWSDRTRSKLGRRLPFVLGTLPLIILGYLAIPYIPTLIPADASGQPSKLVSFIVFFTLACIIYYVGWTPARLMFMIMRQEAVKVTDRVKVESWYNFVLNVLTIIAYTAGAMLYRSYGPSLFWLCLAAYVICALVVVWKYKESSDLSAAAGEQEKSNSRQLKAVFSESTPSDRRNLLWFLLSVLLFTLAASGYTNFASSWVVNMLGVNESQSSIALSLVTIATTVAVLPAGYIAAGKFGRRNIYIVGLAVMIAAGMLLAVAPQMYMIGFILMGVGVGISFPSQLPLATELAPQKGNMGSVISVYNLAYLTGFVAGSFVLGWIIQATSYASVFYYSSAVLILSLIAFLFIRRPAAKAGDAVVKPQPAALGK